MLAQEVTTVSFDSFRERAAGKKVVLLYPWTNYRNLFLTHFLSSAEKGLLYYRIPGDQTTLADWLADLVREFDNVLNGFGKQLNQVLASDNPDVVALGEALAADLGAYSRSQRDQVVLFIDEFDRTPLNGDFRRFITALVDSLPKNVQLAFSSRLLTYQPWYDMVARGEAIVLGTERRKNDVMFTVEEQPKPQLEVYALGRGHALVNGQQISNWDGALPRNLFFYFMDHPLVTRDEIFSVFWPDLPVKEATNVFHVTKRKISERIGMKVNEPGSYELTQYNAGFYTPSTKVVRHYDVSDFQEAVERSMVAADDREEERLLLQAVEWYKAPYLQTVSMPWVENRRQHLHQLNTQALIGLARIYKRREEYPHALGYYVRALKEVPEREDIHREVMSIYLQQGMIADARAQYELLVKTLQEKLNIGPSRESRELYNLIESAE